MQTVLLPALVIAAGGMLSVGSILIVLLLLGSNSGLRGACAYVLGYGGSYGLIGLGTLLLGQKFGSQSGESTGVSGVLFCVLGLVFWFFAVRKWREPPGHKAELPGWFASVDQMRPVKAFLVGVFVSVVNFKNLAIFLSAVSVVVAGELPFAEGAVVVVLADVVFCSAMILPILIYIVFPRRSVFFLGAMKHWLEEKNRTLVIVLLLFFGAVFLGRGVLRLL